MPGRRAFAASLQPVRATLSVHAVTAFLR